VGKSGLGVYLDFSEAIGRLGQKTVQERYGNLFDMYHEITGENAYEAPMRIFPAVHYTMGGLWVDYHLMSNIPGLFALGEANFSDHGANRLGASALMQGLADGYFVIPYTLGDYLSQQKPSGAKNPADTEAFWAATEDVQNRTRKLLGVGGRRPVSEFHRQLGKILWDHCGMSRTRKGLEEGIGQIRQLRKEFWEDLNVPGSGEDLNQSLEKAGRVADFLELGELMCRDALERDESCGCHFREEHQTAEGECARDDAQYAHAAAWEYQGENKEEKRQVEPMGYEEVHLATRSYK
jgi:succinate dehydrogenase / fumarate reductase flavoprotein subunit